LLLISVYGPLPPEEQGIKVLFEANSRQSFAFWTRYAAACMDGQRGLEQLHTRRPTILPEALMDISQAIAELKKRPGFTENVGMVLVHNGVVRSWSRKGGEAVDRLEVHPDQEKISSICQELTKRPGIFSVTAHAKSGTFLPGEDLLFIIVAGDIRESVIPTLTDALNRIKAEAIGKSEHLSIS
jgi:molybdopterin synthase catalytic subunit